MSAFFHNSFFEKHMWVVEGKVGDLDNMANEAIDIWNNRNVAISTLIVCGPGDREKFLAQVDKAPSVARIPIALDYAIAVNVDRNYYNIYRHPTFEVAAFVQGKHRYVHHMFGITGGDYVKREAGPYWLAFVGPLWKDGSVNGPAPVAVPPVATPGMPVAKALPPKSFADMVKGI